ncbi:putative ARAC-type regulatory domain protein [Escherichia coli DEC5E]|nr:putative ARAC-type regulatory domain protein [Escherichia coli DEC5E]
MKKTRTANLHHLYHEPLPENLKLTPKVEVDNVHQRQTTDVYEHALTITAWQQIYDQLHPGKFHGEFWGADKILDYFRSSSCIRMKIAFEP